MKENPPIRLVESAERQTINRMQKKLNNFKENYGHGNIVTEMLNE